MKLWLNGEIMEESDARISPFDHGFLYGMGAFETFRTYEGFPFLIGDHLKRLQFAMGEMGIESDLRIGDVKRVVTELRVANGGADGYFRLNVSAGVRGIGLDPSPYTDPVVMLLQKPLTPPPAERHAQWLKLRRNTPETAIRLKSHHYFNNLAARKEVADVKTEGIFLTEEGVISEGLASNVYWVKDGTLYTPDLSTGMLEGITRKMVLTLARAEGIPVKEGRFTPEDTQGASEWFLSNSIQEIVPIAQFEGRHFPADGPVCSQLRSAYQNKTKLHIETVE
ncbi:4-amino-4-deoxychorismate lyase [Jeotgalibacillus malaysiensis]|uniref:4-amino-4-deoxychorismate lyase n=1 Tax=Jeotgalibacillus malaysiensis TaxID=1508404 RepID=A0A0B5ALN1_9BACL|nr:aminodeoxychorismate lyase [Jeotgalibacillus malaysiensis]AJD89413.1 4-amino-4-deoxychorismate lyase [Jeotgalibacillus malaysiensis]